MSDIEKNVNHNLDSRDSANSISEISTLFRAVSEELTRRTSELEALALRYEVAVESSPTAMIMVNMSGRIILINRQMENLFGYTRDELLGQPMDRLLPDVVRTRHPALFASFFKEPQARSMGTGRDLTGRKKDGSEIPIEIGLNPIKTEGEILVMASVVDISERRQLEARFRLAIEAAPNAMLMVNMTGEIILINQQMENLFGYSRKELVGTPIDILLPDSVKSQHPALFSSFFNTPKTRSMGAGRDLTGRRKDGSEIPIEIGLNPIESEDGTLVMASVVDISERRQLEARFRLAIEAAPNAMLMVNMAGEIILINQQMENLFGYSRKELVGTPIDILLPDSVKSQHPALFSSFFNTPKTRSMGAGRDLTGRRKDGSEIPIEIGLNPIESEDGTLVMASVVDISERRRHEFRLEQERLALARSNADLEEFAYIASHDLKSPLRNIEALANWIEEDLEGKLQGEALENMTLLKKKVSWLESLIDDLLAYSRVGRTNQDTMLVDTSEIINDLLEIYQNPEIKLQVKVDKYMPVFETKKAALEMVFRNLVNNAVKHHDRDEINIEISVKSCEDFYSFSVKDDGPGIEEKYHDQIFGMFKTLQPHSSSKSSGIGLALVKRTIESERGVIKVSSNRNQRGMTFTFKWKK